MKFSRLSLISLIASFVLTLGLFPACDIIEAPYVEKSAGVLPLDSLCEIEAAGIDPFGAGSPATVRKLLLEEMTGHQCGNCPEATAIVHKLRNVDHPGRIVTIAIHAGPLAAVKSTGSRYTTEFRTPEGTRLYSEFNLFDAVPFTLFNRNTYALGTSQVENRANQQLQLPVEAGIRIFNCYDEESRELTTIIDVKYLVDATAQEFLAVYLTEDNIVDWQTDYKRSENDIPDYIHHDVFRGSINGIWGESLGSSGQVKSGNRFTKAYTIPIDAAFDVNQCKVVAFVHDFDTRIVRQVEEAKVMP